MVSRLRFRTRRAAHQPTNVLSYIFSVVTDPTLRADGPLWNDGESSAPGSVPEPRHARQGR